MPKPTTSVQLSGLALMGALAFCAPAQAQRVTISVTGTIDTVLFTPGVAVNDSFQLSFTFDTNPALAVDSFIDVDEVGYEFSGGPYLVSGSIGSLAVNFSRVNVGLADDENLTLQESLGLVPPGVYDGFAVSGQSANGDFDMSTGDINNGTLLGLALYGPTDIYSDASWYQAPPAFGDLSGSLLALGTVVNGIPASLAAGTIDSLSVQTVPLPAGIWLLGSALLGGLGLRRIRK